MIIKIMVLKHFHSQAIYHFRFNIKINLPLIIAVTSPDISESSAAVDAVIIM